MERKALIESKNKMASQKSSVIIEDVSEDNKYDGSVEERQAENCNTASTAPVPRIGQNRNEKKARKALSKFGLKPVPGVRRMVVKRSHSSVLFVVNQPEVLINPGTDTYVVFGVASTLGDEQAGLAQAAQQLGPDVLEQLKSMAAGSGGAGLNEQNSASPEPVEDVDEGDVDETGLNGEDIDSIVEHYNISRAKAIKALRDNGNDVVDAMMGLSVE